MFEIPKIEVRSETRWYMFWLARIFGRKLIKNAYQWRGQIYITGEVPSPFEDEGGSES